MTRSLSGRNLAGSESLNSGQDFPKIEYNQPLSSPYGHPMITLCIGQEEYGVLGSHIQKFPLLGHNSSQYRAYIELSDIHEDVGHTLVHFLYSGTYETINSPLDQNISYIEREFQRSVLIYHASRKYQITDLEILARKYIEYFGEAISTSEILRSTGKIFSKLPEDEVWLPVYVRKVLLRSFKSGNSRFNIDDLSPILKDLDAFSRAIMLSVIEISSSHIQYLEKGTRSQPHFTSEVSRHELTSIESVVVVEGWSSTSEEVPAPEDAPEDAPYHEPAAEPVPEYPLYPDDIPYPEEPPAPEDAPYPDDVPYPEPAAESVPEYPLYPAPAAEPVPEDSPYPERAVEPSPEEPRAEWNVSPDETDAAAASLAKTLLPDVVLYHDWETLTAIQRRKRSKMLKKRNLPIPNADGVVSISLI